MREEGGERRDETEGRRHKSGDRREETSEWTSDIPCHWCKGWNLPVHAFTTSWPITPPNMAAMGARYPRDVLAMQQGH